MAVPHKPRHSTARRADDDGQAQTKTLGILVAVMVVAGVVALIMTLTGGNSGKDAAAGQPSGSQVGNQSSTAPSATTSTVAPTAASTTAAPSTTAPVTTAAPATSAAPATPAATTKPAGSASTSAKVVKYTVKKGDNLTLIATWFNQRGYGSLYDWNKSVIGKNPNLIYAGQTIIVSLKGDHMNVSTGSK